MTARADRLIANLRDRLARWCPQFVMQHVVDQTLADLATDRERAGQRVPERLLVTISGLARLGLALLVSLVILSQHWRAGVAGRAIRDGKHLVQWIVLMTLVLVLYDGLNRPEYRRLWALAPGYVALQLVPLALPGAVLAFVLVRSRGRRSRTLAVGFLLFALSFMLTEAPQWLLSPAWSANEATKQISIGGRLVDASNNPAEYERVRQFIDELQRHKTQRTVARHLPLAAFCLVAAGIALAFKSLVKAQFQPTAVVTLALLAQSLVWSWDRSLPAPWPPVPLLESVRDAWLPHLALAAAGVAMSLVSAAVSTGTGPPPTRGSAAGGEDAG